MAINSMTYGNAYQSTSHRSIEARQCSVDRSVY